VFDPEKRAFTGFLDLPGGNPLDNGLFAGPDGYLYGFTTDTLYRLDPPTQEIAVILREDEAFHVAGPIIGKQIYFGHGHELKSIRMFRCFYKYQNVKFITEKIYIESLRSKIHRILPIQRELNY